MSSTSLNGVTILEAIRFGQVVIFKEIISQLHAVNVTRPTMYGIDNMHT